MGYVMPNNWMDRTVGNNKKLCEILIPGSHDACMYEVTRKKGPRLLVNDSYIITQDLSIKDQLMHGTRFFDIRVYDNHGELHAGHFMSKIATQIVGKGRADIGGFGPSLWDVLLQVRDFLNEEESRRETVILKFSHIHKNYRAKVMKHVIETLGDKLYEKYPTGTVGMRPFGGLRGKVITIYEKGFVWTRQRANTVINYENKKGNEVFDACENKTGKLILRGYFSNKRSLNNMLKKQVQLLAGWRKIYNQNIYRGELMQLYWTSTWHPGTRIGGKQNIRRNTDPLWLPTARAKLKFLIKNYKPNIVLVDFANVDKNYTIFGDI